MLLPGYLVHCGPCSRISTGMQRSIYRAFEIILMTDKHLQNSVASAPLKSLNFAELASYSILGNRWATGEG